MQLLGKYIIMHFVSDLTINEFLHNIFSSVFSYCQNFDLEGESGIVARGIGTAVTLTRIQDGISQLESNLPNE